MSAETVKPEILTAQEVAPLLGVSVQRVYSLIRQKEIPSVKIGTRVVRIPRAAFDEYLRRLNAEALASVQPAPKTVSLADVIAHYKAPSEGETADTVETAPEGEETGRDAVLKAFSQSPALMSIFHAADEAQERHAEGVGHLAKYIELNTARR